MENSFSPQLELTSPREPLLDLYLNRCQNMNQSPKSMRPCDCQSVPNATHDLLQLLFHHMLKENIGSAVLGLA